MKNLNRIGFGGGCHWCTEAVFQSLVGVENVQQGWIASSGNNATFSEAVIVEYNATTIPIEVLIEIHLYTHNSTSAHSMRKKYRSAIYVFDENEESEVVDVLNTLQHKFNNQLVTQVLKFSEFKPSREEILNYYYKNPEKPFCETFINPKLKVLLESFRNYTDITKTRHLKY
ncbi:peptide-methionine (S)-S-oxide reductase [Winogradskyella eximia]|uniref:peptide-methionine (S)-S-oxide reductase n=1 Tax=Winogradskyella eximia TaxID=262006 RepID=UPI002491D60D|nr:peptide-methionine (S)-S-oxide reductase [Winogradskyella eximia]